MACIGPVAAIAEAARTTKHEDLHLAEPVTPLADDPADLAHRIVDLASDKKAVDIVLLRTAEVTTMADYFVITSGRSDRQVQALSQSIVDELREEGVRPIGVEGQAGARWVLIDYIDFVVHVFHPQARSFYQLEGLWGDARRLDLEDTPPAPTA